MPAESCWDMVVKWRERERGRVALFVLDPLCLLSSDHVLHRAIEPSAQTILHVAAAAANAPGPHRPPSLSARSVVDTTRRSHRQQPALPSILVRQARRTQHLLPACCPRKTSALEGRAKWLILTESERAVGELVGVPPQGVRRGSCDHASLLLQWTPLGARGHTPKITRKTTRCKAQRRGRIDPRIRRCHRPLYLVRFLGQAIPAHHRGGRCDNRPLSGHSC